MNPLTARAERWQAEAARLSRINSTTNQLPKEANLVDGRVELHSLDDAFGYNQTYVGEATEGLDSRRAGSSRFPETPGSFCAHEREVS